MQFLFTFMVPIIFITHLSPITSGPTPINYTIVSETHHLSLLLEQKHIHCTYTSAQTISIFVISKLDLQQRVLSSPGSLILMIPHPPTPLSSPELPTSVWTPFWIASHPKLIFPHWEWTSGVQEGLIFPRQPLKTRCLLPRNFRTKKRKGGDGNTGRVLRVEQEIFLPLDQVSHFCLGRKCLYNWIQPLHPPFVAFPPTKMARTSLPWQRDAARLTLLHLLLPPSPPRSSSGIGGEQGGWERKGG